VRVAMALGKASQVRVVAVGLRQCSGRGGVAFSLFRSCQQAFRTPTGGLVGIRSVLKALLSPLKLLPHFFPLSFLLPPSPFLISLSSTLSFPLALAR